MTDDPTPDPLSLNWRPEGTHPVRPFPNYTDQPCICDVRIDVGPNPVHDAEQNPHCPQHPDIGYLLATIERLEVEAALAQMHVDCCPYSGDRWFYGWADDGDIPDDEYEAMTDDEIDAWWLARLGDALSNE